MTLLLQPLLLPLVLVLVLVVWCSVQHELGVVVVAGVHGFRTVTLSSAAVTADARNRRRQQQQSSSSLLGMTPFLPNDIITIATTSSVAIDSIVGDTSSSSSSCCSCYSSHLLLSSYSLLKKADPESAVAQFYFLFFAGSGAGGIGLLQIPRIAKELTLIRELAAQEKRLTEAKAAKTTKTTNKPNSGSLSTGNPLVRLLYPSALSVKNIQQVIAKVPKADIINQKGSSTSYFASRGYIVQDDFLQSLKGCNSPYAAYALFQAITEGKGRLYHRT